MDPAKLLQPNPFSGDDGGVQPQMAHALACKDPAQRSQEIVGALTAGRVFVPVSPHAHPGISDDGAIAPHTEAESALADESEGFMVAAPGQRRASSIFSSAERLAQCFPQARPLPVLGRNIAAFAARHKQILALDPPDSDGSSGAHGAEFYVGIPAAQAIAAGEEWLAPWQDTTALGAIKAAIAPDRAAYGIRIQATPHGVTQVFVNVYSSATREDAMRVVGQISRLVTEDPYLASRLDMVEILPVRLA